MAPAQHAEFARIAAHLQEARPQVLLCWQRAVGHDPEVPAAASLARAQFLDHVPKILDAFDRALRARSVVSEAAPRRAVGASVTARADELAGAAEHGEDRWLHGYNLRENLREWGHLHMALLAELESFGLGDAGADAAVVSEARTMLAQLFVDCMVESAASHAALERAAAETRLQDLERVVVQLRDLERERTELWREAAHDLRGNVGAVKLAATALGRAGTPEMPRFVGLVRRTADSLDTMLNDLIELARLEAGREQRNVQRFNVHTEVGGLCESLQPLAASRHLFLKFEAPQVFVVDGDAVKVRRIAQNLVLNALKYTEQGGVTVSCSEVGVDGARWMLSVQDTGVGINARIAAGTTGVAGAKGADPREFTQPSEGIGLSIVKRLCVLLDAHVELVTGAQRKESGEAPTVGGGAIQRGTGTTFRITFPRQYRQAGARL